MEARGTCFLSVFVLAWHAVADATNGLSFRWVTIRPSHEGLSEYFPFVRTIFVEISAVYTHSPNSPKLPRQRTDKSTAMLGPCGNDDVAIRTRESTNVRASVHPSGRLSEGCSEIVFPI